ncbi:RING finger 151-like [Paramuricea clavata]|uniref:RING finger 151-like n=1 Tax=Paramuricea clavata TaxID=317549 RepID=A0A7D9IHQ0_PARCT|nr:RING finger 151-like [Paramuricea clavata]
MASKLAVYDTGYEDELFQYPVGPSFHCCICTNVIKDPVMCQQNEHIFCRACVTRHLVNFQTCPTCMEPLTVETLSQAPRGIRNLLAELKIRCEFFDRGCGKFIDLGDLERHVTECGFAPAVCSNEGCQLEVNKQDLLHHETSVCELRRVQCHSCKDIRQEMDTVKVNLAAMNEKLDRNEKHFERVEENLKRNEENVKAEVKNAVAKVDLVQEQLNKQEESNCQLIADNVEMKKSLNEIMKQLERITQQTSHEEQAEETKKGIAEADGLDRDPKVVIAGGWNGKRLNSVEVFSLSTEMWTLLQPMEVHREGVSSVVYNNQLFVIGGFVKTMEKLSLNDVHVDQSIPWENVPAGLPEKLAGHCSVVYNGRLIVIGGYVADKCAYSDSITEISLVQPYTSKLLTTMPQTRCYHGVAIFGDKILIVGGRKMLESRSVLRSVVMYDIAKNECQGLAPLPYPVCEMATVKWDDDNVIIMGGADSNGKILNKVLMYNIKTQKSRMLPDMKYKRSGCVAAVVRDTVIVMGGLDERSNYLNSVESFRFNSYMWQECPGMLERRCRATVVVC